MICSRFSDISLYTVGSRRKTKLIEVQEEKQKGVYIFSHWEPVPSLK
jgi:hypothetical protein